jgi:hypothetical protein
MIKGLVYGRLSSGTAYPLRVPRLTAVAGSVLHICLVFYVVFVVFFVLVLCIVYQMLLYLWKVHS